MWVSNIQIRKDFYFEISLNTLEDNLKVRTNSALYWLILSPQSVRSEFALRPPFF
jgi:hypothetical protein